MRQRRFIIIREARVVAAHNWIEGHPQLDPRGGGGSTFSVGLALPAAPLVTVARGALWSLPEAWWEQLRDHLSGIGWKRNTTDMDNDISDYPSASWSPAQVLADTRRKPVALVLSTALVGLP